MGQAAGNNFRLQDPKRKTGDCHPEVERPIQDRITATPNHDADAAKNITKEYKRARQIRTTRQTNSLRRKRGTPCNA